MKTVLVMLYLFAHYFLFVYRKKSTTCTFKKLNFTELGMNALINLLLKLDLVFIIIIIIIIIIILGVNFHFFDFYLQLYPLLANLFKHYYLEIILGK